MNMPFIIAAAVSRIHTTLLINIIKTQRCYSRPTTCLIEAPALVRVSGSYFMRVLATTSNGWMGDHQAAREGGGGRQHILHGRHGDY